MGVYGLSIVGGGGRGKSGGDGALVGELIRWICGRVL